MVYDFGLRLKELRDLKGLSQKRVGSIVGVSKTMIYKYESNTATPKVETLKALAVLFRVSTDYLLGLEKRKTIFLHLDAPDDEIIVERTMEFLQGELNGARRATNR